MKTGTSGSISFVILDGLVDWPTFTAILRDIHYDGSYAIEDFLTPRTGVDGATQHLRATRLAFENLLNPGPQGAPWQYAEPVAEPVTAS